MRSASFAALAAAVVLAAGCAGAPTGSPDILYVATPEQVGLEMLKLAGVTKGDVVYDLGSGDGRLMIAAAREFGARGVGVEIEAHLVQDSRESALKTGVAGRARFLWQDIWEADVTPATVVTLSHDFDMGDWRPDRTVRVQGPRREHVLYLWDRARHGPGSMTWGGAGKELDIARVE